MRAYRTEDYRERCRAPHVHCHASSVPKFGQDGIASWFVVDSMAPNDAAWLKGDKIAMTSIAGTDMSSLHESKQWRGMARYEGEMPTLGPRDFVVVSPEVSGAGGMSVPAELGEIGEMFCKVCQALISHGRGQDLDPQPSTLNPQPSTLNPQP